MPGQVNTLKRQAVKSQLFKEGGAAAAEGGGSMATRKMLDEAHKDLQRAETIMVCTLQHAATHCNTLQHTAAHCNTLQHTPAAQMDFTGATWVA